MKKTPVHATFLLMFSNGNSRVVMMTKNNSKVALTSVEQLYYDWIEQVEKSTGDPEGVLSLYADNAVLLPTLSPKILSDKTMLRNYFRSFLALEDTKVTTVRLISKNHGDVAMNAGLYTFTFKKDGKTQTVDGRFDFWYKKVNGEWKIIFHQSSILPKSMI